MAVVLAGLIFSLSASAQTGCPDPVTTDEECFGVPMTAAGGQVFNGQIPKFDSSLGTLISAKLTTQACTVLTYRIDSEDPGDQIWNVIVQGGVILTPPVGPQIPVFAGTPDEGTDVFTGPDDEPGLFNSNFAGPDFAEISIGTLANPVCNEDETDFDTPAELAIFSGVAGEVLPVQIRLLSNKDVRNDNSSNYGEQAAVQASGSVCVEYTYQPPCPRFCINGTKINDCTGEGIPGWQICLSNSSGQIACILTDASGDYSFCDLFPGTYQVTEETREGWVSMDATVRDVILDEESAEGVDFTNAPAGCISGNKFNSKTNEGLSGWTINLKDANGAVIKTTTTGTGGLYQFCGLLPGSYTVCEVQKAAWKAVGPTCIDVELVACENSEDNDFFNEPSNLVCVCPFFIKNDFYTASCNAIYEVDATKGILANDPPGSIVLNPESITIDPKYGTITVEEDGSFVYDPTGATGIRNGVYVIFKYAANNGLCDSKYLGIAKIQVSCK
jgi:hypothetical protein